MQRLREGFEPDWYTRRGGWAAASSICERLLDRALLTTHDNRHVSGRGVL